MPQTSKQGAFGAYGTRPDGTMKGKGWLGALPTKKGNVMSELSVHQEYKGKEVLMPLIVPTLSKDEINFLQDNEDIEPSKVPLAIRMKALRHAHMRISKGLSPYKD